jgi:hypothetical protein
MKTKHILFYVSIICFFFTFYHKDIFSKDINLKLKQSIDLNNLAFASKNRLIKIQPRDGFIIEVKGKKEKRIVIVLDIKQENNGIKIVELKPEKKIIRLNKNGMGTFRIGALVAVKNTLQPGLHYSEVRARFKYLE